VRIHQDARVHRDHRQDLGQDRLRGHPDHDQRPVLQGHDQHQLQHRQARGWETQGHPGEVVRRGAAGWAYRRMSNAGPHQEVVGWVSRSSTAAARRGADHQPDEQGRRMELQERTEVQSQLHWVLLRRGHPGVEGLGVQPAEHRDGK